MSLHTLANKFRSQLQSKRDTTAQSLTEAHAQTMQHVQPQLDETYKAIEAKQITSDGNVPLSWLSEGGHLDALKQFVSERIDQFSTFAKVTVQQVVDWAHSLAGQAATMFLKIAQPDTVVNPVPQPIVSKLLNGARENIAGLFGTFGRNAAKGIEEALKLGLALGDKVSAIAENVKTVLDEPRWRAIAIATTAMFTIFSKGLMANYGSNAHVAAGWLWNCRMSPHSCIACILLHGTIHKLDEELLDHPQGQCFPTPYFLSMTEIEQGSDWFEKQDEATKREILGGQKAYELYKSGVALQSFIGIRHSDIWGNSVYQRSVREITKGKG